MNIKYQIINKKSIRNLFFCGVIFTTAVYSLEWNTYTNSNYINNIISDNYNIYCATRGGFTIFSKQDSFYTDYFTNAEGLTSNHCNCLMFDQYNTIWIGTDRGIVIYDIQGKTLDRYYDFGGFEQNNITCLEQISDTVLVGTNNGLIIIDRQGTPSITDDIYNTYILPSQFSSKIFSLEVKDNIWIGACPGLIKLSPNLINYTAYINPFGDSVKAMQWINDSLYIATELGVARFNNTDFDSIISYMQKYPVFDFKKYENKLYIATSGGLLQYDWQNLWFIINEEIKTIDTVENLWVGTGGLPWFGGGIKLYKNNIWQQYLSNGLVSNNVSCVVSDDQGDIYATHYPTLTNNFRKISYKKFNDFWQVINDTLINCDLAAVSPDQSIWFGHWFRNGGISRYISQDSNIFIKTWDDYKGVIGALGIDNNKTKWTYNQNGSVIALDTLVNSYEFIIPGLSRPEIGGYEFAIDLNNIVWLATSSGLVKIDCSNTLSDFSDDIYKIYREGLPNQEIFSITVDAEDRIWCATIEGVAVLVNESFQIYNTNNSQLPSNRTRRIKADEWGNIWILSAEGLTQYNIYSKEWSSYNKDNSMIIPNIENDDKFYQWLFVNNKTGTLLIASKEGISEFSYNILPSNDLSKIRIYPNPFIISQHQIITFDSLPKNSRIYIYSIEGKLITELNAINIYSGVRWEANNLSSGIYLAVIKNEDKHQILKFAVIR